MKESNTLIIAHRGASYDAPENTLEAVHLAWEQQADAVEVDVHLSADGHLMVIHDDNTQRTAGRDRRVREQTLQQLKKLDAGSWKDKRWAGARIPTLNEVLQTVPPEKGICIEIKGGADCLPVIRETINATSISEEQIIMMDFDLEVVKKAKNKFKRCTILWLVDLLPFRQTDVDQIKRPILKRCAEAGLDGIGLRLDRSMADRVVTEMKQFNLDSYVWTVNDGDDARYFQSIGMKGITTDRPGWLRKKLHPRRK